MAIQVERKAAEASDRNALLEVLIASDATEARRVQEEIEAALKAHQYSETEIFSIRLALEEALIRHPG